MDTRLTYTNTALHETSHFGVFATIIMIYNAFASCLCSCRDTLSRRDLPVTLKPHTHTCVSRVIAAWTENIPLYSTSSNFPNKQTQNISSADNKHRHECFFGVCARLIHISGSHAVKIEFRVCDMVESPPPPPPTRLVWIERTRWVMHALTHAMCVGVNEPGSRATSQGCWDNIEYIRNFECGSVCGFWANVNCSEQFFSPIG